MQPQGEFNLRNIDSSDNTFNRLYMNHQSNQNRVLLENYVYNDSSRMANFEQLISNSVNNVFSLLNYNKNLSTQTLANNFVLASYSAYSSISMSNKNYSTSATANEFTMTSNSSNVNTISLQNYDNTGTSTNYITMDSSSAMMHIWSKSDIYLQSSGAIRMSTGNTQDITMTSADDIHITWSDKLYLNGNQMAFKSFTVGSTSYTALCVA